MKTLRKLLLSAAGFALLGACSAIDINSLRALPSKGTPFQTALKAEYTDLAYFEDELRGDWDDAVYYDKRARASAAGQDVEPETLKGRSIPSDHQAELEAARIGLVAALGASARVKAPKVAARAQAMFDCWMEEQEENFQPDDIARCRAAFDKALAAAEGALVSAPKPAPAPAASMLPKSYVVYFGFDSAALDTAAMAVIHEAAADAKAHKAKTVAVAGHTDTAGANAYNLTLSDKRTDAVTLALVEMGVSGKAVKKSRHGETQPAVATGDNKRERRNRRVHITLSN